MNVTNNPGRAARSLRIDSTMHLFAVGQAVRLKGGLGRSAYTYHITGALPSSGGSPQYRIRNDGEQHERVATQDQLELPVATPGGEGAALIERTFSHR